MMAFMTEILSCSLVVFEKQQRQKQTRRRLSAASSIVTWQHKLWHITVCRQPNIDWSARFVLKSFSYTCGSSITSASVFADYSVPCHWMITLSVSSFPRHLFIPFTSHINITMPAAQPFSQFLCHLLLVQSFWNSSNRWTNYSKIFPHNRSASIIPKFFHVFAMFRTALYKLFFIQILHP